MDIGEPLEVIEVLPEPMVPYEGEEVEGPEPERAPAEEQPAETPETEPAPV